MESRTIPFITVAFCAVAEIGSPINKRQRVNTTYIFFVIKVSQTVYYNWSRYSILSNFQNAKVQKNCRLSEFYYLHFMGLTMFNNVGISILLLKPNKCTIFGILFIYVKS